MERLLSSVLIFLVCVLLSSSGEAGEECRTASPSRHREAEPEQGEHLAEEAESGAGSEAEASEGAARPWKSSHSFRRFEITFGDSFIFSRDTEEGEGSVQPFASKLFLFEYRITPRWHSVLLFNLPTQPLKTLLADGTSIEEPAGAALAIGLGGALVGWDFSDTARVEIQAALVAGVAFREERWVPFPLGSVRLHILQDEGFGLYLGAGMAPKIETLQLIYGMGYRF